MSLPLFALFLAAFGIGTGEFVIAGLLPDISADLGVSIPIAGYLVTFYALGVAVGGPLTTLAIRRLDRRTALLLLVGIYTLGQVLCALAPNYPVLILARIATAFTHGTYFGVAVIAATKLVAPERAGSAIGMLLAGLTVANIVGVPIGTAIGDAVGWRATFWAVGGLTLLAFIAIAVFVPRPAPEAPAARPDLRSEIRVLGRQPVFMSLVIIVIAMIGQFSLFTYIAPLLTNVTGLSEGAVPWLLLLAGMGATAGVLLGGRLADWRLMPTLAGTLVAQALIYTAIGILQPFAVAMGAGLFTWGGSVFAFGAAAQTRVLRWASDAPNLASPLLPTAFNIGIAFGATIGSVALDRGAGYGVLPWIGLVVSLVALVLTLASWSLERRSAEPVLP